MSTSSTTALFNRPDTMFGVCEGIGREFGFHPNILRIGFGVLMIWNPVAVIGTYVGLGAAVAISRLVVPVRKNKGGLAVVADTGRPTGEDREVALAA